VNNNRNGDLLQVANDLMQGTPDQIKMGTQILANMDHMRNIKKSGLINSDSGEIPVYALFDDKGNKIQAKYTRAISPVDQSHSWTVTVNGVDINDGQPLYGEREISVALYNFVNKLKK
jgi:hypothetical protein